MKSYKVDEHSRTKEHRFHKLVPESELMQDICKRFLLDPVLGELPGLEYPAPADEEGIEGMLVRTFTCNGRDLGDILAETHAHFNYTHYIDGLSNENPDMLEELIAHGFDIKNPDVELTTEDKEFAKLLDLKLRMEATPLYDAHCIVMTPRQKLYKLSFQQFLAGAARLSPWLTDGAVDFLESRIDTGRIKTVMEFGAGSSTWWLAKKGVCVFSVEDNPQWVGSVLLKTLYDGTRDNVFLTYREAGSNYHGICADVKKQDYKFDLVLVDAGDRFEVTKASIDLIKPGGYLMLDNDERSFIYPDHPGNYSRIHDLLKDWPKTSFRQEGADMTGWTSPHEWITTVWQKPQ